MRKIFYSIFLLLLVVMSVVAQENATKSKSKFHFESTNLLGLLEGEQKGAFQAQSINGVRNNSWFAGLGAGLDNYVNRSIPVFLDVRKNILNKRKTPFVYGDIGMHFIWNANENEGTWYKSKYNNGLYYGMGIGYRIGMKNQTAFNIAVGYSFKSFTEYRSAQIFCITGPCPEAPPEEFEYKFRRISMLIGFSF